MQLARDSGALFFLGADEPAADLRARRFHFLLHGNIVSAANKPGEGPICAKTRHAACSQPAILAVKAAQAKFVRERFAGFKSIGADSVPFLKVFWMYAAQPASSDFVLQAASSEIQPALIKVRAILVLAGHPHQNGRRI